MAPKNSRDHYERLENDILRECSRPPGSRDRRGAGAVEPDSRRRRRSRRRPAPELAVDDFGPSGPEAALPRLDPRPLLANDHDGCHDRLNGFYLRQIVSHAVGKLSSAFDHRIGLLAVYFGDDYRWLR